MKNMSPENVIIGMQNNLESLHKGQVSASELVPRYRASTVAEKNFARTRQKERRESHRRKTNSVHHAEDGTADHAVSAQQERES